MRGDGPSVHPSHNTVPAAEVLYDESIREGFSARVRTEKMRAAAFVVGAAIAYVATAIILSVARVSPAEFGLTLGILGILVAGFVLLRWLTLRDLENFPLRLTRTKLILHHRHIPYTEVGGWTIYQSRHLLEVRLKAQDGRGSVVRTVLTGDSDVEVITQILTLLEPEIAVAVRE